MTSAATGNRARTGVRHIRMRTLTALLATAAVTVTACAPNRSEEPASGTVPPPTTVRPDGTDISARTGGGSGRFPSALQPFDDCDAFLSHVRREAMERVGPYGLDHHGWFPWIAEMDDVDEGWAVGAEQTVSVDTAADGGDDSGGSAGAGSISGTNVQEAGIDEADVIKTDGSRIVVVHDHRLSHVDITGEPTRTGTVQIPPGWGHEIFLEGDRVFVFANSDGHHYLDDVGIGSMDAEFAGEFVAPRATVTEIDISSPTDLRVVATMRIDGEYLSSREIDGRVRIAVSSTPAPLPWLYPQNQRGEEKAIEANREVIAESVVDDWLPSYSLLVGDTTTTGPLVDCGRAHHPADFSGFDMVSVVDIDLGAGLSPVADAVGVLAQGRTVYSSLDRMYVATTTWGDRTTDGTTMPRPEAGVTDVHAFALSPDEPTTYVASGTVDGSLLNQFSLDEHDGFLRVVTTVGDTWGGATSETKLTVFEEQGERLERVGQVGGLGKGERLFSARLLGDVGFAVTFRQIDPFYVLDLSDPRDPRVTGELKIPGVSTYLHPVGEHHVLGIGQNATDTGMVTGLKLSLFDVSDPANPRETSVWTMDGAESPVEHDHRAFQMTGSTAIVPVSQWGGAFNGAVVFEVADRILERGRITHDPDGIPQSDCRTIASDQLTPDESELWWILVEGAQLSVCEPGEVGSGGAHDCERFPASELEYWIGDHGAAGRDLDAIGAGPGDTIELCWPGHRSWEQIQRSVVIDGTVWTFAPSMLQANDVDDLQVVGRVALR